MKRRRFDIETNGLENASVVHCLIIQDADTGEIRQYSDASGVDPPIAEGLADLQDADVLIGHNILSFDLPTLKRIYPSFRPVGKVRDTLIISRLIWPDLVPFDDGRKNFPGNMVGSHSLEAWGHRLGLLKGTFGKLTDWAAWSREMQDYCVLDVKVTALLDAHLEAQHPSERAIDLEHRFRALIDRQERHGFRFDENAAGSLYSTLVQRREELVKQLQTSFPPRIETMRSPAYYVGDVFGEETQFPTKTEARKAKASNIRPGPARTKVHAFNPASRSQIAERLIGLGWKPTKFTDTGKPQVDETILDAVLADMDLPEAKLLNEYLMLDKRIGQLATGKNAWLKLARAGRMHGEMITNGAVTGRCSHLRPNMGQVPAVHVGKDKKPILGGAGGFGWECRSLFLADLGWVLVGADASGLELRTFSHYLARYDGGAYGQIVCSGDIHTANMLAAGLSLRDQAKTFIYAFLYGAGNEKLGRIAGVAPEQAKAVRDEYRAKVPEMMALYRSYGLKFIPAKSTLAAKGALLKYQFFKAVPALAKLVASVQAKAKKGFIIGLDGRKLWVRSLHSALNTLLQSAGALIVKLGTVLFGEMMEAAGHVFGRDWALVAHVHDEMQITCRPEIADFVGKTAVEAFAEAGRQFDFRVPITGEYKIGANWAQTH